MDCLNWRLVGKGHGLGTNGNKAESTQNNLPFRPCPQFVFCTVQPVINASHVQVFIFSSYPQSFSLIQVFFVALLVSCFMQINVKHAYYIMFNLSFLKAHTVSWILLTPQKAHSDSWKRNTVLQFRCEDGSFPSSRAKCTIPVSLYQVCCTQTFCLLCVPNFSVLVSLAV